MENSMQEQTQNDKMVPIDTSGDAVEVELKEESQTEEVKTTEPEVQVEEVPQEQPKHCLLYTSPSPRDRQKSRMPSSA